MLSFCLMILCSDAYGHILPSASISKCIISFDCSVLFKAQITSHISWTILLANVYIFSLLPCLLLIFSFFHIIPAEIVHIPSPSRVRRDVWPFCSKSAWHWSCWQSLLFSLLWRESFWILFNETVWLCFLHPTTQNTKDLCAFPLDAAGVLDVYPEIPVFLSDVCCAAKLLCSHGFTAFPTFTPLEVCCCLNVGIFRMLINWVKV